MIGSPKLLVILKQILSVKMHMMVKLYLWYIPCMSVSAEMNWNISEAGTPSTLQSSQLNQHMFSHDTDQQLLGNDHLKIPSGENIFILDIAWLLLPGTNEYYSQSVCLGIWEQFLGRSGARLVEPTRPWVGVCLSSQYGVIPEKVQIFTYFYNI